MRHAWCCVVLLALAGCCGLDLRRTDDSQLGVVDDEHVELTEGLAAGVRIGCADDTQTSSMRSLDPGVLSAEPTLRQHEFLLLGVAAGATTVEVLIDGDVAGELDAVVLPPPE